MNGGTAEDCSTRIILTSSDYSEKTVWPFILIYILWIVCVGLGFGFLLGVGIWFCFCRDNSHAAGGSTIIHEDQKLIADHNVRGSITGTSDVGEVFAGEVDGDDAYNIVPRWLAYRRVNLSRRSSSLVVYV